MIMRDVNAGYLLRYTHANVASFFFIFVYAQYIHYNYHNRDVYKKTSSQYTVRNFSKYHHIVKSSIFSKKQTLFVKRNLPTSSIFTLGTSAISVRMIHILPQNLTNKFNSHSTFQGKITSNSPEFLQWFVGFTDAVGCFLINTKKAQEAYFTFKINLPINDIAVLYKIQNKLQIGVVFHNGKTCTFRVSSFQDILDKLLPIFDNYKLLTHKQLDYRDWKKAILLKMSDKNRHHSTKIKISKKIYENILQLKNNFNGIRLNYDGYIFSDSMMNKYWLIGFVEGNGAFNFSNTSVVFEITHNDKKILDAISNYIKTKIGFRVPSITFFSMLRAGHCKNLKINLCTRLTTPKSFNCIITLASNNSYKLTITDKNILYVYIYPLFLVNNQTDTCMLSRKGVDFKIWCLVLHIFIHGYHELAIGKKVLFKLSNIMNSSRYFLDLSEILPGLEPEINTLLYKSPVKSDFSLNKKI